MNQERIEQVLEDNRNVLEEVYVPRAPLRFRHPKPSTHSVVLDQGGQEHEEELALEDLEELNEEIDQSNGPFQGHHQPNGPFQCHQILRKDASITNKTKHSFHFFSKILFTFFKKYDLVVFTLFPKNNFFFFSQFKEKNNCICLKNLILSRIKKNYFYIFIKIFFSPSN